MEDRVTRWYEAYSDDLLAYVRFLLRDHPDAEDIHATVFLEALQKADQITDESRGWFFQCARWRVIDWRRAQYRRPAVSLDTIHEAMGTNIEDRILDRVVGAAAWNTTRLTHAERFAFWYVYAAGRSIAEVAAWAGTSPNALKACLHRARVRLAASPSPIEPRAKVGDKS